MLLNKEDSTNNNDFYEITDNDELIANLKVVNSKKPDDKKGDELPRKTKLYMFLIGFSYGGLILASLIWSFIIVNFVEDAGLQEILIETFTYLSIFFALLALLYPYKNLILPKLKNSKNYLYGFAFAGIIIVVELVLSYIINFLYQPPLNENQAIVENLLGSYPTLMLIITVIIAPICEELTYRVGLFGLLRKKGDIFAIIVSGLIFGLVHLSFVDSDLVAEFLSLPIYFAIGCLLALAYKKHGFACSVVAHASINLISFLFTLFL